MSKEIKAILFDLGNVLIKLDFESVEKRYMAHGRIKEGSMIEHILDSDTMNRYMEGKIGSDAFYRKTTRHFRLDIGRTEFFRIWNSMFSAYPEMEDILKTLKEKYPHIKLVLISNTCESHYDFIKEQFSVLRQLDDHVVSHVFGAQKPDPSIYFEALKIAGALPKDTFYADDRPDLIDAARRLGIHAFQFTTHEELKGQLAKFNIKV
ncbi:MAG: HAD family phosphatase [Candidatus Omnitrophica bacterium]|nr:HAD family phosphatase [Candidatus Omnitrophota bacterium]